MRQRSRFARWISIALIIGLVVTCMPMTSALAEVQPTQIANESDGNEGQPQGENGQPQGNEDEPEGSDGGETQGTTQGGEEGEPQEQTQGDNDAQTQGNDGQAQGGGDLPLTENSGVSYVERTLTLTPELYFATILKGGELRTQVDEYNGLGSVPIGDSESSEAYLVFNSQGENSDSFSKLLDLLRSDVQIQAANLMLSLEEEEAGSFTVNAYPLLIGAENFDEFNKCETLPAIPDGTLASGLLCAVSETDGENIGGYSINLLNEIATWTTSGRLSDILSNGWFGYALRLTGGSADISAVQLVITYLEPEETTPSQAVIEAADAMLAARENIQQSLEGSGTVSDPYLIFTADQLCGMVENDNACYKLMRDIDLEGYDWRPPGYYYWYPFMGYLDGNGHTIKNLYVGGTQDDAWNINAGGLFGYFEGRVENLHVETVKAKRKGVDFFGYAGGIAGVANAPAEIINCSVNGYISGNGYVGGIVGVAYPGVIIESCCAIGTVDMSQAFAYINDNGMEVTKEVWDTCMSLVVWGAGVYSTLTGTRAASGSVKKWSVSDYVNMFTSIVTKFPIDELFNTGSLQKLRKCCVGGLVGLNYATIRNSYSSTDIEKPRSSNYLTVGDWGKTGGVVGRNMDDYADVSNCFYNIDCEGNDDNEGGVGTAKTTEKLKSTNLFGSATTIYGSVAWAQWNHDLKLKSADGLPLPVCNYVNRALTVVKVDGEDKVYQPDVYYDSRVLMKTRESFFLGTETEDGSLICSKCVELKEELETETNDNQKAAIEKQIAVTGIYQRGSDARPYHVHDLDSLLAMQDNKESHFILCCDIDFKVSNGKGKTVQKYWWPAGKTHFSPIKGSLKGNTSCNGNTYIYEAGEIKPLSVKNKADRFTIKNLTVQSNRHAGLFASFRGTFSDINIELARGTRSSWRDGIKNPESSSVVGIFTIGNKASAGAVAGETVNGALIRECFVSGGISDQNEYMPGYIKGAIRTGGIVGMNNRGSELDGCDAYVDMDARNFDTVYLEDDAGTNIDIINNALLSIDSAINILTGFANVQSAAAEMKNNKSIGGVKKFIQSLNLVAQGASVATAIAEFPIIKYFVLRYSDVCIGGLVGENYGNIMNTCIAVKESSISALMTPFGLSEDLDKSSSFHFETLHCGRVVGRNNWVAGANDAAKKGNLAQTGSFSTAEVSILSPLVASKVNRSMNLEGKGTESEPFIIRTEDDIKTLAATIKNGKSQGIYIKQVKDISLSDGSEFKGFEGCFEGTYDGNGYSISGLTTNRPLFAGLSAACVKNLILKNSIIMSEAAFATTAANGSRIQNCGLERNVQIGGEGASAVAGFVGSLTDSAIYNVYNYAVMRSSSVVCGIAREIKGSSEVVSCYTDIKQPTPPTQDAENSTAVTVYAVAQSVAATADYRYCRWSIASDAGTAAATDSRSEQKKNADKSGQLTEAESGIFTLRNLLEGNAQKSDKQESDKSKIGYTNDATWALGEADAQGDILPGFYFYGYRLQGSGKKEQPYIINDALDFEHFTQKMRLMADSEDLYFKQTADIAVSETANANLTANSKASDYNSFKGCYDGGYHSLSGINIDNAKTGDNTTAASIFGKLEGATVKNLEIKGSSFKAAKAAVIATEGTDRACLDGSEKRNLIQNCWTEPDVTVNGSVYAGGLLGDMEKTDVYACASYAEVGSGDATVGGIAYKLTSGEIKLCISAGSLSGGSKYRLALLSEAESRDNYLIGTGAGEMSATNLSNELFLDSVNDTAVRSGITALGKWKITSTGEGKSIILPSATELKPTEQDGKLVYADRTSKHIELDYEDFSAGKGTRAEPYEIYSIEELARVNHHIKEGTYFRLMADLDFSNYCKTHDWVAIGTDADYFAFQGVFDGNGYTISNLTMTSSSTAGLFGYCAGTVKNLKVVNFNINTTGSSAGAIVGELCAGGRVEQCAVAYADGKETHIDSAHYSGGIVGVAQKGSVIRNVYADRVHASLSNILVLNGGEDSLLGGARDSSTLSAGFTDGWSLAGEFIGILDTLTKASGLFSTNAFSSLSVLISTMQESDYRTAAAGGIVGFLGGTLENSWVYRSGIGKVDSKILSSATAGLFSAYEGEGVGRRFYGSVVGKNQSVNVPGLKAVGTDDNGELSNKNYTVVDKIDEIKPPNDSCWNGRELKVFGDGMRGQSGVAPVFDLDKELSAIEPLKDIDGYYMVTNANELAYIEFDPYSNYKLMNDIDLSGYNWVPLCRQRDQYFAATLDGQGYSIYGLHVETNEDGGLFGYVLGTVTNLNIGVDVVDAYGSAGAVAAGVYYPGKLSKVSVVPTAVAKAMMAERIISVIKKNEDQIPSTEQALLKKLLGTNDALTIKAMAEAKINDVYNANDIQAAGYSDKAHIIGGGNDDGAGVGGLVGIVGKDVDVKDCYSRVNVSNANFAVVKSFDRTGFVLSLIDSLTEILDPVVSRISSSSNGAGSNLKSLREAYNEARNLYERELEQHNKNVEAEDKIVDDVYDIYEQQDKLQTEINEWESKAKAAGEEISKLGENITALEEKKTKQGKLSESEQNELNECKTKKANAEKNNNDYNKKKEEKQKEKTELEGKLEEKLGEFDGIYKGNRQKEESLKNGKERLDEQAKEINSEVYKERSIAADLVQRSVQIIKTIGDGIFDLQLSSYDSCVGGLVGECRGRLVNCYTVGKLEYKFSGLWSWINGGVHHGTLVGRIRHGGGASSNGQISSQGQLVSNCYYYPENAKDNSFGNKIRDWHPKDSHNVEMLNWMYTALEGFDFSSTWKKGAYSRYPELVSPLEASAYATSDDARMTRPFAQGSGTEEDPYIISTVLEFLDMAKYRKEEYYYKLACDIDLTPDNGNGSYVNSCIDLSTDFFGGVGYGVKTGIVSGYDVDLDFDGDAFAGHFDGNGYKIKYTEKVWSKEDIENKDPYYYACGLFPVLSGSIENLELECTGIAPKARYRGLIAGRMLAGSRVENVKVSYQDSATMVAQVAVGGMVGSVEKGAYIGNCVLDAPNLKFVYYYLQSGCRVPTAATTIGENAGTAEYLLASTNDDRTTQGLPGNITRKLLHKNSLTDFSEGNLVDEGFDFNNTWTMDDAKPTLRCLRSTDKYQYDWKLRVKACETINTKEITMTDSDTYKHQSEQASISGMGTKSSPFVISSPKDFMAMMYAISGAGDAAGRSYSGVYFEQTEDICLDLKELAGIKYTKNNVETSILGDSVFGGNYDGNGHIIELTDTGSGMGIPKLFKSLSGVTFRNCIFIAPKNQEGQTSILLAEEASNSLFLNCDLIKVNKLAYSMQDVSMLNNLYENSAVIDGIVKSECFNGRIVGIEDAAEAACSNNKETIDDYNAKITETACAELNLMTGLPEEMKKMAYAWSYDGLRYRPSTDSYETVGFDLGEGVEIKSVAELEFVGSALKDYHTLPESTYIRDGSKLVAVRVPAGTVLNLELSYTGTADEAKYVVITGEAAGSKPNLKELILALAGVNTETSESNEANADNEQSESTAPDTDALFAQLTEADYLRAAGSNATQSSGNIIGTLPSDTTQLRYEVISGDNTISIYKQSTPYKAELIFDKPFVGASVKKVRFCFTERIYEELEPEELQIEGLNNHLVGEQTVSVLRPVQALDEDGNPTVENMRFETKVSLWDLDNLDSLSIDTRPSRYYYLRDDVKAGTAGLIDLSGVKLYAKKNGTEQMIDIEDMFAELPDGKISQYYEVEPIVGSDGKYEDVDPTGTHRIALKTPELSGAPNNQPIAVTMWIRHQAISFDICIVDEIPLTSIEISKLPNQTAITAGQAIDLTGGKLKLHYDTYRTEEIDLKSDMVSASLGLADANGRAEVTVSYAGCTTTYTVDAYEDAGVSIDYVLPWGTTQRYRIGTSIEYLDWQIKILHNNNKQEIKSLRQILAEKEDGEDTLIPAIDNSSLPQGVYEQLRNYTLRYKGHEVKIPYYIYERDLTELSYVADSLTAVQYKGVPFNTSGGQLIAGYSNNTTRTIGLGSDEVQIEFPDGVLDAMGKFAVTGDVPITVSYTEEGITKSTRIHISVQHPVQNVTLTRNDNARTIYPRGVYDELLYSDYTVTVTYAADSGLQKEEKSLQQAMAWNGLRFGGANIVWNGDAFDGSTPGKYQFKLSYDGMLSAQSSVDVCDFKIREVNMPSDFDFIAGMSLDELKQNATLTIRYRQSTNAEEQTSAPVDETVSMKDNSYVDISSTGYDYLSLSMASIGEKAFTVTYGKDMNGAANTFDFKEIVKAKSVSIIEGTDKVILDINGKPLDSTYWGKIQATSVYDQQIGTVEINDPVFTRNGSSGSYTVTGLPANVSNYMSLTKSNIRINQIDSIALSTMTNPKTEYLLGEQLGTTALLNVTFTQDSEHSSGMVHLSDADVQIIMEADVYNSNTPDGSASTDATAPKTLKKLGNHSVTVAYGGATVTYNISVQAKDIEKVSGYEPKNKYLDGEGIDFSNMRIKVLGAGDTNFGTYRLNQSGIADLRSKLGGTLSFKEGETLISDQMKLAVGQGSTRNADISVCYGGKEIVQPITIYRAAAEIGVQADRRGTAWYGEPDKVNAGSSLAVKNNSYSGASAYYSRKAYVQFDLSDAVEYASDNGLTIDSLTLSFKAKNNKSTERKTKIFDVLGAWPTTQKDGVTVNNICWNTAKNFTLGTWSKNVNIKEEKTYTLMIPKSLIRDKLILGIESSDKNGGDMQYVYADSTMKLEVKYALNKEVSEIKDITGYKSTYMRASSIDKSQGSFKAVYTDGSFAVLSFAQLEDSAFSYNFNTNADEATVSLSYGGKTAEYTVELVENGISAITGISDTEFMIGQQMKSSEVSLHVRYNDGSTGSIPMSDGMITIGRNGVGTYTANSIGTQDVTVYCSGLAQGYDVSVNVGAVYIDWVQMPSKRSGYYVGEELDLTRGSIKAYGYSVSGSSRPESAALTLLKADGSLNDGISVSGDVLQSSNGKLVLKKAGTNTINIRYGGKTLSYNVTAEEPWVTEITGLAAYSGGEHCILLGDRRSDSSKCISVKYADGSSGLLSLGSSRNATAANITITGCGADAGKSWNVGTSAANSLSSTVGVKHVNISYSQPGHSVVQKNNYEISVVPVSLSLVSVKTDYVHNQEFDRTQGSITAIGVNNVKQENIPLTTEAVAINGYDKTKIGTQLVTVSYMGKNASVQVTVAPKSVSGIRISKLPTAKYCEGQNSIDLTGGQIVRIYNDGTEDLTAIDMVDGDTSNVTVVSVKEKGEDGSWTLLEGSSYDMSADSTYRITLAYAGKQAYYDVVAAYDYSSFNLDVSGSKYTIKKSGDNPLKIDPATLAVKNNTANTGANTRYSYMSFELGNDAMGDLADILDDNKLGIKKVTLKLNAKASGALTKKDGAVDGSGRYVELYVTDTDHKASWDKWNNKPLIKNTLGSCKVRSSETEEEFSIDLTDYIKSRLSNASTERSKITLGLTAMQTNGPSISVNNTGSKAPQLIVETYEKELEPAGNYTVAEGQNRVVEPAALTVRAHGGTEASKTAQSYISFSLNNPGSGMLKNKLQDEGCEIEKATLRFKAKLTNSMISGDGSSDADGSFIWLFIRNVEQEGNGWLKWSEKPTHNSNLLYSTQKVRSTSVCEYEIDVTNYLKQRVSQSSDIDDTITFALSASTTNTAGISILNSLTGDNKPELIIQTKKSSDSANAK